MKKCVMAQHFLFRPFTVVIYNWSLMGSILLLFHYLDALFESFWMIFRPVLGNDSTGNLFWRKVEKFRESGKISTRKILSLIVIIFGTFELRDGYHWQQPQQHACSRHFDKCKRLERQVARYPVSCRERSPKSDRPSWNAHCEHSTINLCRANLSLPCHQGHLWSKLLQLKNKEMRVSVALRWLTYSDSYLTFNLWKTFKNEKS